MNLDPQKSAQPCGCDEGADWVCERHKAQGKHKRSCPAYGNYQPPYEECNCGVK